MIALYGRDAPKMLRDRATVADHTVTIFRPSHGGRSRPLLRGSPEAYLARSL
jgi:hypothetical protein